MRSEVHSHLLSLDNSRCFTVVLNQRVMVYCVTFGNEDWVICPTPGKHPLAKLLVLPSLNIRFLICNTELMSCTPRDFPEAFPGWSEGLKEATPVQVDSKLSCIWCLIYLICIFKYIGFPDKMNKNQVANQSALLFCLEFTLSLFMLHKKLRKKEKEEWGGVGVCLPVNVWTDQTYMCFVFQGDVYPTGWESSSHCCLLWERRNEWSQRNTWKHFQVSTVWYHSQ